jgi:hypothetical protein
MLEARGRPWDVLGGRGIHVVAHRRNQGKQRPRDTPSRPVHCAAAFVGLCGTKGNAMPVRVKKLIGTFLLVLLVAAYAILATIIAVARLAESGPLVHLAYFFFTGLLWVLPAMLLIKWMTKPPRSPAP